MGENLRVFWKREKMLGKKDVLEQSDKKILCLGTVWVLELEKLRNEWDTTGTKEEIHEGVNTLLLYYVSQKVIPTFQIG